MIEQLEVEKMRESSNRPPSQRCQNTAGEALADSKVKQQNFLKKGDKSRVYDPREAIKI